MNRGFQNESLAVRTRDGLDDDLLEPLYFLGKYGKFYRAPIGSTTDGLSTPWLVRMLPGYDATGDDWWSGVLHDAAFRNFLEIMSADGNWERANLKRAQCDDLILDAMTQQGVGFIRRHVIYFALVLFGGFAFRVDRRANP